MPSLGERIRRARERVGITQDQLARQSGVTRTAISQWEANQSKRLQAVAFLKAMKFLGADPFEVALGEPRSKGDKPLPPKVRRCAKQLLKLPPESQDVIYQLVDILTRKKK